MTIKVKTFDEILKASKDNANGELLKATKRAELAAVVNNAEVAHLQAQANLERAIITQGVSIADAAANAEKLKKSFEYVQDLYNSIFPAEVA